MLGVADCVCLGTTALNRYQLIFRHCLIEGMMQTQTFTIQRLVSRQMPGQCSPVWYVVDMVYSTVPSSKSMC